MSGGACLRWRPGDDPAPLVERLARGGVLAIPTESSYGLGVDPRSAPGVAAVYRLKRRERGKPLPVVAADLDQILSLGVPEDAPGLSWAMARWPAALSLVAPIARPIPASGGDSTIAVRIPDHAGLRELLHLLEHPLTATSANPSGEAPYLGADEVATWLTGRDAIVVDGGVLAGGAPSTLVRFGVSGPEVLRQGRVAIR